MQELDAHLKSDVSSLPSQDQVWSNSQALEALSDVKVWIYFLLAIAIYVCNGGVTAFGSYIIKSFGYSSLRSLVLQVSLVSDFLLLTLSADLKLSSFAFIL